MSVHGECAHPASNYFLSSFGGAVRNAPAGGSAFPHRDALFYCESGAGWNGCEPTSTALGWVADFARALRPYVDGAYVNVPNAAVAGLGIRVLRLERVTSAAGEGHLRPAQRVRLRAEHSPSAALMTQPPATSKTSGTQKVRMSITPDDRDTADRWFLGRGMPAVLTSRARYRSPVATIGAGVGRLCHRCDRAPGRVLPDRDPVRSTSTAHRPPRNGSSLAVIALAVPLAVVVGWASFSGLPSRRTQIRGRHRRSGRRRLRRRDTGRLPASAEFDGDRCWSCWCLTATGRGRGAGVGQSG